MTLRKCGHAHQATVAMAALTATVEDGKEEFAACGNSGLTCIATRGLGRSHSRPTA
jgi:hypothetical protein